MQKFKLSELHHHSSEVLTKEQMKKVLGGLSSGACYIVQSEGGHSSCWFATSGNSDSLCSRVYPNDTCISSLNGGSGTCSPDCHMN